eukprot:2743354-Prymnesium_polylepis.2
MWPSLGNGTYCTRWPAPARARAKSAVLEAGTVTSRSPWRSRVRSHAQPAPRSRMSRVGAWSASDGAHAASIIDTFSTPRRDSNSKCATGS